MSYVPLKATADPCQNTFENPKNVVPDIKKFSADDWKAQVGKLSVRKHSWSFFMFEGELA